MPARPASRAAARSSAAGLALAALLATACRGPLPLAERVERLQRLGHELHFLEFDEHGTLTDANAIELAARSIARRAADPATRVERIVLFSLGWRYDIPTMRQRYVELIERHLERAAAAGVDPGLENTLVACVVWDSAHRGVRRFANDLIPFATLADVVAFVPDALLFPLSFWSKAALADRIGRTGLRDAMEALLERAGQGIPGGSATPPGFAPEIVLVGHSFGCRVLASFVLEQLGTFWSSAYASDAFRESHLVRSALFLQPALVELNVPTGIDVVVTQSRHDHANGFLFPLANLPMNAYGTTEWEGLFGRLERDEWAAAGVKDGLGLPFSVAYSAIGTPVNYAWAQGNAWIGRPLDWPFDTLAQLPLAEIPVELADRCIVAPLAGEPRGWGERSKGALNLGAINESAARLATPHLFFSDVPPTITLDDALRDGGAALEKALRSGGRRRCVYVDCSDEIRRTFFGLDLGHPLVDWTLSWLDPVGAHSDIDGERVFALIRGFLARAD